MGQRKNSGATVKKVGVIVKSNKFNCYKCGKYHGYNECSAYEKVCNNCGYKNHFSVMCKNKNKTKMV